MLRLAVGLRATLAILIVTLSGTATYAATEKVLHSFGNGKDGAYPQANLIFGAAGNLYGTTHEGGANGYGMVFELTPKAGGSWTEKILHSFGNGKDGFYPFAGLIFDAVGNLYGTTIQGGAHGYGTAFELTPTAGGSWTETVLYSFSHNGKDGFYPVAGLIFDAAGNLYGTTEAGGAYSYGTVFELKPTAGGGWTETVLHSFKDHGTDGANPSAGLIFDDAGNLYGTTAYGGSGKCTIGCGTVFELTPTTGGGWTETVLNTFNGKDGANPLAGLIFDAAGNLYGTAYYGGGGAPGRGTVFELTPKAGGGWTETVLHSFKDHGTDGANPSAGLIFDAAGNLYGTTNKGGAKYRGTVFELTPKVGGGWTETVLHSFDYFGTGGYQPQASLIFDTVGNLYGTAYYGGSGAPGRGTVFQITP